MAHERYVTPEKQLLKLIEEPKDKGAGVKAHVIKYRGMSFLSFGAWLGRFHFSKNRLRQFFDYRSLRQLDIRAVNSILFLGMLITAFYFIYSFSSSLVNMKKARDFKFNIQNAASQGEANLDDVSMLKRSETFYLDKVRERDIFKIGAKNVTGSAEAVMKEASTKAIEATQHLRLVGISWSSDPDAMIEDTKALKTFFVKRGQAIGDIKVEAILKDKIILNYKGEEVEMR